MVVVRTDLGGPLRHLGRLRRSALLAAGLLTALSVPASAADLQPGSLPRGTDLARPYLEDTTIIDGARVVDVPVRRPVLVAPARGGYVVGDRRFADGLVLIDHVGTTRRLPGADTDLVVSADGRLYSEAFLLGDGITRVGVRRVSDGERLAGRTFTSGALAGVGRFARPIDIVGNRMLVGGDGGRVMVWNWKKDLLRTVVADRWHLQVGSLADDIAAGWTAPGERCTVVARLSTPRRRLWKSCEERVVTLSPDGRRLVTTDRRVDPSFGRVQLIVMRTVTGRELGRWTARRFTDIVFESDTAISFRVDGSSRTAMVRCSASRCQAASDPLPLE